MPALRPTSRVSAVLAGATMCLVLLAGRGLSAQEPTGLSVLDRSFGVALSAITIRQPIVRYPSGGAGLPLDQSVQALGVRVSWIPVARRRGAVELAADWVSASFGAFDLRYPEAAASDPPTHYANPRLSLFSFDFLGHWAPAPTVPWSVYVVLGAGTQVEKHTVSGAPYTTWNGERAYGEFQFSYGVGTSLFARRYVSLFADVRFVPGDLITTDGSCYTLTQGDRSWSSCARWVKSRTRLISVGVVVRFPWSDRSAPGRVRLRDAPSMPR